MEAVFPLRQAGRSLFYARGGGFFFMFTEAGEVGFYSHEGSFTLMEAAGGGFHSHGGSFHRLRSEREEFYGHGDE